MDTTDSENRILPLGSAS